MPRRRTTLVIALLLGGGLSAAGCSHDSPDAAGSGAHGGAASVPLPATEAASSGTSGEPFAQVAMAEAPTGGGDSTPAAMDPLAPGPAGGQAGSEPAPPVGDAGLSDGTNGPAQAAEDAPQPAPAELPERITVWLAGDSTVANGVRPCPVGWGAKIGEFFSDRVTVRNVAVGGASVTNWSYHILETMDERGECEREQGTDGLPRRKDRFQGLVDGMQPGDYLFVQFGINDGNRTCPYHAGLVAFKEVYGDLAHAAEERGAHPIFVTPVSAIKCREGTAQPTRGAYVTTTFEAGEDFGVPVIDLHALSIAHYAEQSFCPIPGGDGRYVTEETTGAVGAFFCDDNTHFSAEGALGIAALVAEAVEDQGLLLSHYLR